MATVSMGCKCPPPSTPPSDPVDLRRTLGPVLQSALRAQDEHRELIADIERLNATNQFDFESVRAAVKRYEKYPAEVVDRVQSILAPLKD